ncbi:general secretion pathway protein GspB [uncultured Desulfobacter sp.]|uniref:general secretion pathway protein GspB n=1 Tax=uncultured Desulfobacter sp. TaxID=240139 RepID=UPI002AAAAC25|nr:general secretion pathway protein GspB [uncultured Desulfobacter sp.]
MSTILRALKEAEQASKDCPVSIEENAGFKFQGRGDDMFAQRVRPRKGMGWIAAGGVVLSLIAVAIYVMPDNMFFLQGKQLVSVLKKENKGLSGARRVTSVRPQSALSAVPAVKSFAPILSRKPFDPKPLPVPVTEHKDIVTKFPLQNFSEKSAHVKGQGANLGENIPSQIMEPENLKLQAISWSKTPSARVAVINNRVLGEKDTIERFEIININENDIILSNGSAEIFRLAFENGENR